MDINGAVPPARSMPPNIPKSFCAPWQAKSKPTTMRITA
jgi:hypothetical protein